MALLQLGEYCCKTSFDLMPKKVKHCMIVRCDLSKVVGFFLGHVIEHPANTVKNMPFASTTTTTQNKEKQGKTTNSVLLISDIY